MPITNFHKLSRLSQLSILCKQHSSSIRKISNSKRKKQMSDEIVYEKIGERVCALAELPKRRKNQLLQLLELFPDKKWSWHGLSRNPNITIEWIIAHPELAWNWASVCANPNLTMNLLFEFLLPKLEPKIELYRKDQCDGKLENECWRHLSGNPGLKIEEILAHHTKCELPGSGQQSKWWWDEISKTQRRHYRNDCRNSHCTKIDYVNSNPNSN